MRTLILSCLLLLFVMACGETQKGQTALQAVANKSVTLSIEGMVCIHGCKNAIEEALKSTSGVTEVAIDFDKQEGVVLFDDKIIDKEGVIAAITAVSTQYKVSLIKEEQISKVYDRIDVSGEEESVSVQSDFGFQLFDILGGIVHIF